VVPLDAIVRSEVWLSSPFKFIRTSDPTFKDVMDVINCEFVYMSVKDLEEFWNEKDTNRHFWDSKESELLGLKPYNVKDSVELVDKFLHFQFNGDINLISEFLSNLCNVLNRLSGKRNTVEVISPPSSGKNWFFDPILTFMGSYGQIMNAKKNTQFPLDNCFNKRVLYFNEPNFENSFQETLLMLFAGDPLNDHAKYKSVAQIVRTPVIVTGNRTPFSKEARWNDRMFRYNWKRCELLQQINKKLNPLFFVNVLKKYNIKYI
jgi:hypothetical protein